MKALRVWVCVPVLAVALGLPGCHKERVVVRESAYVEPGGQYVIVNEPPPPLIVEGPLPRPSTAYIWIDGYWDWDGHRYVWAPGRWTIPPHGHAVWDAPRYERHEAEHRYRLGRWREGGPDRGPGEGPGGGGEHRQGGRH